MISLTYSWETDRSALLLRPGQVAVPRMDYFYPQAGGSPFDTPPIPSAQDEAYTAHMYTPPPLPPFFKKKTHHLQNPGTEVSSTTTATTKPPLKKKTATSYSQLTAWSSTSPMLPVGTSTSRIPKAEQRILRVISRHLLIALFLRLIPVSHMK